MGRSPIGDLHPKGYGFAFQLASLFVEGLRHQAVAVKEEQVACGVGRGRVKRSNHSAARRRQRAHAQLGGCLSDGRKQEVLTVREKPRPAMCTGASLAS